MTNMVIYVEYFRYTSLKYHICWFQMEELGSTAIAESKSNLFNH